METPRGPLLPLGEKVKGLNAADEDLKALLEKLVILAERDTLFSATTEFLRLESALLYGGYLFSICINMENQIAPGGTVTTYVPIVPGYVFIPCIIEVWSSLPWWISAAVWADSDLPMPPTIAYLRAPDHLRIDTFSNFMGLHRFLRYTVTNNHAVNIANICVSHFFDVMTEDAYKMVENVYLKPLIDYVRDKAEEVTGRPYP